MRYIAVENVVEYPSIGRPRVGEDVSVGAHESGAVAVTCILVRRGVVLIFPRQAFRAEVFVSEDGDVDSFYSSTGCRGGDVVVRLVGYFSVGAEVVEFAHFEVLGESGRAGGGDAG